MNTIKNSFSNLFSLEDICFNIEGKVILSKISVVIDTSGITGIIGPSGSGKSTFLRLLNKLISPTQGIVKFKDSDIANMKSQELRKEIGMVLQRPFLFKGTVKSNLLYGPKIWDIDYIDSELVELLDTVSLEADFLERDIEGLSGGEQQRVSLARSLANQPIVLLLDEPTTALDIVSEEIIENTLKQLASEGIKIIIVTHSLEQTKRLTEQLLFLKEGLLIEKTTTKDFFKRYNDQEIHSFFKNKEGK
jgi:putative ABC transport system ATP-binding protein